jgi:hypothetical protein
MLLELCIDEIKNVSPFVDFGWKYVYVLMKLKNVSP